MAEKTRIQGGVKFGEAVVLFVLILGLTVFIGVKMASRSDDAQTNSAVDAAVVQPATENETPTVVATEATGDSLTVAEVEPAVVEAAPAAKPAGPPAPVNYGEAEDAYLSGSYDEAADLFTSYTEQNPQNAWGQYMLGMAMWKSGDAEGALDGFQAALDIAPQHVKSLVNSGRVLLELQRPTGALEVLNRAAELAPDDVQTARVLARAQAAAGLAKEAETTYRTLLSSHPDDAWSLNNLGLLLIQQGRCDEAVGALACAAQLDADLACVQNNLGAALERTGHFAAARDAYGQAVQLNAGYAKAEMSRQRLEGVQDAADRAPFDLATAAAAFAPGKNSGVAVAVNDPTPTSAVAEPDQIPEGNR